MKKNLVLFFTIKEFEKVHLYKDVGLLPYYLCKKYNLNGKIIYSNKEQKNLPNEFRGLELEEIKYIKTPKILKKVEKFRIYENLNFYKYLVKNAKRIDYLMLFHYKLDKIFLVLLYKFLNSKGKVYIKLDFDGNYIHRGIVKYLKSKVLNLCEKKIDLISVETTQALEKVKKYNPFDMKNFDKLIYLPNGFDEEYLEKNKIKVKKFEEKENIMITVGRLGAPEKNNELLLKALENLDLKDWKILLIGPYTKDFRQMYDNFIERNKDKKDKVLLIGKVENKDKLYDYYNKSKVFILTSRYESYGLVLNEAYRFKNYIITTDVGAARDIVINEEIGKILLKNNMEILREIIIEILRNKIKVNFNSLRDIETKKTISWEKIVENPKLKILFQENRE